MAEGKIDNARTLGNGINLKDFVTGTNLIGTGDTLDEA